MPSSARGAGAPLFHGWVVAAASGFGLACSIATVVAATFSIFVGPIRDEFGWSASAPFWAPLAVTLTAALCAPFVGGLVDRHGPRRVILVSFVLEALVLASFHQMDGSLAGLLCTLRRARRARPRHDPRRVRARDRDLVRPPRGLALGVALAGVGVGGVVLPLFCQWLIGDCRLAARLPRARRC